MSIPKRSTGPRAPSKLDRAGFARKRPGGAHYAAVLAALKNKPAAAAKDAAVLDRCSARQPQACTGRDGGMAAAEQRNASLSWSNRLFLRERAELRRTSRRLTSEGRIEKGQGGKTVSAGSLDLAASSGGGVEPSNSRSRAMLAARPVLANSP